MIFKTVVPEKQNPLRILLVEDAEDNRLLIQFYLENAPYRIDIAENGQIAVEKFKSKAYDLVLMDMQMPVMDGYTATREIRAWEQEKGLKPTPIIALTAYVFQEEVQKSLEAGCTAHVTKPMKKATLMETIQKYTESRVYVIEAGRKSGDRIIVWVDADLEKLIPRFLMGRHNDISSVLAALERGDYKTIQVLGHSMKGSGGSYGLDVISEIGRSLEQAALARDSEEIGKCIKDLLYYLEHVEIVYK